MSLSPQVPNMRVAVCLAALLCLLARFSSAASFPIAINTWSGSFERATEKAYRVAVATKDPVLAVVEGCRVCQSLQCDGSVGFGGSPDESGDTTLDAMIINGDTMQMGSVGFLSGVKDAIGVAYQVYKRTEMTLLAGAGASQFAKDMKFEVLPNLETPASMKMYEDWKAANCQPNYWVSGTVTPEPTKSCGPYAPVNASAAEKNKFRPANVHYQNHDTIAMIVIAESGQIAAGVSTNGLNHKLVGRIGDSALPGAGAFADSEVGGCGETGDGDIMLRFSSCALVVEWMRGGMSPQAATTKIITRISKYFPSFIGGIIAIDKAGQVGAAAYGWTMTYSLYNSSGLHVFSVPSQ